VLWSPNAEHWIAGGQLPGNAQIRGLAGTGSGLMLAATSSGLMRSGDFGQSWGPVRGELGAISIQAVARDPAAPGIFVAAAFGVVYSSSDGGLTWTLLDSAAPPIGDIRQLLISTHLRRLFALTENHGVFTWSPGDSPSIK
jgi:photosystem II stability/assembly factor-like uncharacterized protein